MRLNDATVDIGTQCSGLAVWRVHMNLDGVSVKALGSGVKRHVLVIWEVGVRKIELNYSTT
jgi:hypothetical protein